MRYSLQDRLAEKRTDSFAPEKKIGNQGPVNRSGEKGVLPGFGGLVKMAMQEEGAHRVGGNKTWVVTE